MCNGGVEMAISEVARIEWPPLAEKKAMPGWLHFHRGNENGSVGREGSLILVPPPPLLPFVPAKLFSLLRHPPTPFFSLPRRKALNLCVRSFPPTLSFFPRVDLTSSPPRSGSAGTVLLSPLPFPGRSWNWGKKRRRRKEEEDGLLRCIKKKRKCVTEGWFWRERPEKSPRGPRG